MFILQLAEQRVATEKMNCDALTMWMSILKNHDALKGLMKGTWEFIFQKLWKGINEGSRYIHYEFLDEDSGEILEFNSEYRMNKMMCRWKIYPPEIYDEIVKYFRTHELNKLQDGKGENI